MTTANAFAAPTWQILPGDVRAVISTLPSGSVHCVVTSPPYWGLRDYQTATWEGGDPACGHSPAATPRRRGVASSTLRGGKASTGHQQEGYREVCPRCGARRIDAQLGLEPIPDCLGWATGHACGCCYVCHMVAVMREIKRVLRADGTLWLNLGDSYNGCVDDETEALTGDGWKRWDELAVGDAIFTLDPETYQARWGTVTAVNVFQPSRRRMLALEGRGHSSLTTDNHRWYTRRRTGHSHRGQDKQEVVESTGLNSEHRIPIAATSSDLPLVPTYPDDLVEAVAWYWTEGSDRQPGAGRTKQTGIYIHQSHKVNPGNVERIKRSLTHLWGEPTLRLPGVKNAGPAWCMYQWQDRPGMTEFRLNSAAARILRQFAPGKIPAMTWLRCLTQAQLDLFIEVSLAADGHARPGREITLAQSDRDRAEAFQIACILSGKAASLARNSHGFWVVEVRRNRWIKPMRHPHVWIDFDGLVWCPTTDTGSWLARRRGQVFFTGNSGGAGGDYGPNGNKAGQPKFPGRRVANLKPKDLCGIPWRVALALQADGWYLRRDVIWSKKAPMPESVKDRPATSHEYIFLLTKSERYFYDAEAVKESSARAGDIQTFGGFKARNGRLNGGDPRLGHRTAASSQWGKAYETQPARNCRSVWELGPNPYPEAHFATFPPEIPRRAILAGTSEAGCCPACGAPYRRVVVKPQTAPASWRNSRFDDGKNLINHPNVGRREDAQTASQYEPGSTANRLAHLRQQARQNGGEYANATETVGWTPGCACNAGDPLPCVVLDPFAGSCTTLAVAFSRGRSSIGVELNPAYIALGEKRLAGVTPPLPNLATILPQDGNGAPV